MPTLEEIVAIKKELEHSRTFVEPILAQDAATPLHDAAMRGDVTAAQELLVAGADANACDTLGMTPLHIAYLRGDIAVAQCLLAHGANARPARCGVTPLYLATHGFLNMEAKNEIGETLIFTACRLNKLREVSVLVALGMCI